MKPVVQEKDEPENGNEQFYGISYKNEKNQLHAATEERMLRGKPKAQKEKSLPQLNHFLTEKVAKSVVRSSFLVYHLFAVRIRLLTSASSAADPGTALV